MAERQSAQIYGLCVCVCVCVSQAERNAISRKCDMEEEKALHIKQ
jgi:hypothetical protein